ncbi:MAG TPA: histidine kinase, partial [Sphingobium sp.]
MKMKSRNASTLALLGGCASVLALAAPSVWAQAGFQGTPTVQGTANPDFSTPGTIVLRDEQTVINWRPNDTSGTGEIDFLPSNQTVLFRNEVSGVSNFTVLNRILPVDGNGVSVSRVVALNGTVQSQLNGSTGGSVWFYSPGGIVAGPNSLFNVGSLVLTSRDIDATGGLYGGNGDTIRFGAVGGGAGAVEVKAGADIRALSPGSYVALVAPRVVQRGTVTVNGAAAYVGAEAVDITINGGLFDIAISAGTDDPNGVVHEGTTARVGSGVSSDAQSVYMVAAPKNNVLTMLLSGDVGYDAANSAVQDDSAVVLSAGHDIAFGSIGARNTTSTAESGFTIGAGTWQPGVTGAATGEIEVRSSAASATRFAGDVDLRAGRAIILRADQGGSIDVGGRMDLIAGTGGLGGKIDLLTFGGQIAVTGDLSLNVSAFGGGSFNSPMLIGGNATGGEINVTATGGSISAASLFARANALGGAGSDRSGDAAGGSINLSALTIAGQAGSISFGDTTLEARAGAEFTQFSMPLQGGDAVGGTINVMAAGGSFSAGSFLADVSAFGDDASDAAGTGVGGGVTLSASSSGGLRGNFALGACGRFECGVDANGFGGYGANGATGTGGTILIHATDADFTVTSDLFLDAAGVGGGARNDGMAGRGGDGLGGDVTIESRAGAAGSGVMSFANIFALADGSSTQGSEGPFFNVGDGGTGTGGAVNMLVAGGQLTATALLASASGSGGASGINCPTCEGGGSTPFQAGTGQGGSAQFLISGGSASIGSLELLAEGAGGEMQTGDDPDEVSAIAGQGIGGSALLESRGGTLQADTIEIEAKGAGGSDFDTFQADGVDGGAGRGGTARLVMAAGGSGQIVANDGIVVRALGEGGTGSETGSDGPGFYLSGGGGSGTGGTAELTLASGALTAPSVLVSAEGVGGAGGDNSSDGPGGAAGNGVGGVARLSYLNEGHSIGDLTVKADGQGGQAGSNRFFAGFDNNGQPIFDFGIGDGGAGGNGTGGSANMLVDVDPAFVNLTVSADGIGSAGGVGATSGPGGTGAGGVAALNIGFGA